MDVKYQFNKTALQSLDKDLKVRVKALPTLHAKEAALRAEVKRVKEAVKALETELLALGGEAEGVLRLFGEFPEVISLSHVRTCTRNIAGVRVPEFEGLDFSVQSFSLFSEPKWLLDGLRMVRETAALRVRLKIVKEELRILQYARRKTTQKVNLYEKVQIPAFEEAIRRIKRFLEDEENLAKSAQKLLKARKAARAAQCM